MNFADFLNQTHQVHNEIKCDIQIMTRGLMYHFKHPEVHDLLPDLSSIEDWLFMRDPDGDSDVSRVHFMLLREPTGAQTKLWKRMTKLTIQLFKSYWERVESEINLFDSNNAYFDVWEFKNPAAEEGEAGIKYVGMRNRFTGLQHGIVRCLMPGGGIVEATFKDGCAHGLYRAIFAEKIWIRVCKNDDLLA